jgi:oligoendopeptidase F
MNKEDITTEWDLTKIYDGDAGELAEKDIELATKLYEEFATDYRQDDSYLKEPSVLAEALERLENLGGEVNLARPIIYYSYKKALNSRDQEAESKVNQLSQTFSKLSNKVRFFELELGKISEDKQEEFLASRELAHYNKYLTWLFKEAQYDLDETAENILSVTNLPRRSMWVDGVEKVITQKSVEWEGEELPLQKAINQLNDLPTDERRELHKMVMKELRDVANFSESEINAVVTDKKIIDELRGYETPQEATVLGNENTLKEVEALAETVTSNFDVAQEFYELKAELLGLDTLTYADRSASVGKINREFSYKEGYKIVQSAFRELDEEFADIFTRMTESGQVDVYPREGKSGGAFCSGTKKMPTYVLLNYVDNLNSVNVLAHEFGHAINFEMLQDAQKPIYQDVSTATTETASTFFEKVVFSHIFKELTDEEKIIALHDKINGKISLIFRQIAFYNFEKELHAQIRKKGSLPHAEIAELLNKHMKSYLGERFELSEDDGYFFVTVSHLRRFFYVYTYAYGDLISSALHSKVEEDEDYIEEVKTFLRAGTSKSPADIFGDIGIDTTKPDVFETGIADVKKDIETLRKFVDEG